MNHSTNPILNEMRRLEHQHAVVSIRPKGASQGSRVVLFHLANKTTAKLEVPSADTNLFFEWYAEVQRILIGRAEFCSSVDRIWRHYD